jgi:type IX secretion system PorP/SprF family membrane protein
MKTMSTLHRILFMVAILMAVSTAKKGVAQDFHYSQFDMSPLALNPAFTGIVPENDFRFSNHYKRQWNQVSVPYRTLSLAYDMSLWNRHKRKPQNGFWGVGASIVSDKQGTAKVGTSQFNLYGSGTVFVGDHSTLSAGVQAGRHRRAINYAGMSWDTQYDGFTYDPALPTGEAVAGRKTGWWDIGTGVLWSYFKNNVGQLEVGGSYLHATSPDISFTSNGSDKLAPRMVFHLKSMLEVSTNDHRFNYIVPRAFVQMQAGHMEMLAGATYRIMTQENSHYTGLLQDISFEVGGLYRVNDGPVLLTRIEKENYIFGFSYDITTSSLAPANGYRGGVEFTFGYIGDIGVAKPNRKM